MATGKENLCGHLVAAQFLKTFSDSICEPSESQLRGLVVYKALLHQTISIEIDKMFCSCSIWGAVVLFL